MTRPSPEVPASPDSQPPRPAVSRTGMPSSDSGLPRLDYEDARVRSEGLDPGARTLLCAALVLIGLVLCGVGNRGKGRYDLTALVGIGCVIAGIFGHFSGRRPAARGVRRRWAVQTALAVVLSLAGAFLLAVTLQDSLYEFRRGRWDPPFVRALLVIGCGILWFMLAKLGSRWDERRRAAAAAGVSAGHGGAPEDVAAAAALSAEEAEAQRRRRRRVWGLAAGIFAVICAIPVVDVVSGKLRLRRLSQACMTHTAPPEQVVFTEDPTEARQLLAGGGDDYHRVTVSGPDFSDWEPLDVAPSRAQRYGGPLTDLLGGWWLGGFAFLHARRGPDGDEQVVAVIVTLKKQRPEDEHRVAEFEGFTVEPARWPNPRRHEPRTGGPPLELALAASDRLRVLAGQPDPRDPSGFTIHYSLNGQPGRIDGRLSSGRVVSLVDAAP